MSWIESVNDLIFSFDKFLAKKAPELVEWLRRLKVSALPDGTFVLDGDQLITYGEYRGDIPFPKEEGVFQQHDGSQWTKLYFYVQNETQVLVHPAMPIDGPSAFLASLLSVIVSQSMMKEKGDQENPRFRLLVREKELALMRIAHEEYFDFQSELGQIRIITDALMKKFDVLDVPDEDEETYRYSEYLWASKEKIDQIRPESSPYLRATFANVMASLMVSIDISGGYGGPSVREYVAIEALSQTVWTFDRLFRELNREDGLIFGPLLEVHFRCWEEMEGQTFDDDPEDEIALEQGWQGPSTGWTPDWN